MFSGAYKPSRKSSRDQAGFASIIIAMVLVLVLSLITVGFAQLMQREQRSALDKQLSSQAYYASESGINDAAKAINAGYATAKTDCRPLSITDTVAAATTAGKYIADNTVSAGSTQSSYPCLLIDPAPLNLEYSSIDVTQSKAILLTGLASSDPASYAIIGRIDIGWQSIDNVANDSNSSGNHEFKPLTGANAWTYSPVLRMGLTPLSSGNINRQFFLDNTMTAFLYPNKTSVSTPTGSYSYGANYGANSAGSILDGNCHDGNTPRYCNVSITALGQVNYLLDLRSIYANSRVTITAYGADGITKLHIKNAQTVIDSTGKAQDVVRRVQVRLPSHNDPPRPDFNLQTTGNICKQLKITLTNGNDNGCTP